MDIEKLLAYFNGLYCIFDIEGKKASASPKTGKFDDLASALTSLKKVTFPNLKQLANTYGFHYKEIKYFNKSYLIFAEDISLLSQLDLFMSFFSVLPAVLYDKDKVNFICSPFLISSFTENPITSDQIEESLVSQFIEQSVQFNTDNGFIKLVAENEGANYYAVRKLDLNIELLSPDVQLFCLNDVTEYQYRELKTLTQDRLLEMLVENANEALLIAQNGKIIYCNKHVELLTGYSHSELISKNFDELIVPEDRQKVMSYHTSRMMGDPSPFKYSFRFYTKNGTIYNASVSTIPISWNGKPAGLVFLTNLDERKLLEDTLIYTQKMDLLGRTASAIFHDFNNLMTIIISNAEMIGMLADDPKLSQYIHNILSASEQATSLTSQLRFLGKKKEVKLEFLNLNQFVEKNYRLFEKILPSNITLQFEFEPNLRTIVIDRTSLQQIFLNLIFNARDSIKNKGTIRIRTCNIEWKSPKIFDGRLEKGNYVCLEITDTGQGIPSDKLPFIFEPFFSTKHSHGTGLGLTIIHSIVKQLGGGIFVKSKPDMGTTFRIYFPASHRMAVSQIPSQPLSLNELTLPTSHILLVEDDFQIRDLIKSILRELNMQIIEVSSVEQAINYLQDIKSLPDLIISDIMLPGKSGTELYDYIKHNQLTIPILFISAFPETDFPLPESNHVFYLPKPFGIKEFFKMIQSILKE